MQLVIEPSGTVRCIYTEEIDLAAWAVPPSSVHPASSQTSRDAGWPTCPPSAARS